MGIGVQTSPIIALLNMGNNNQLKGEEKEPIIMVTAARLIFANNQKNNQLYMEEWYKEMWTMAINDKLTCETKIRKGILNTNDFKEIWNLFLVYSMCLRPL